MRGPALFLLLAAVAGAPDAGAARLSEAFGAALGVDMQESGDAAAPAAAPTRALVGAETIPAAEMAHLRGGFSMGGLEVSFGFDVATSVGGTPLQRLTLDPGATAMRVTDFGPGGTAIAMRDLAASTAPLQAITQDGMTRLTTGLAGGNLSQMLVNRADGALLQRTARLDVDIGGMTALLARAAQQSVLEAALGARQPLGR